MKKYNLEQKIKDKTLCHAIVLCGQNLGEVSHKIAKSFVCKGQVVPCEKCNFCIKADKGLNPDIIIVDFEDKNISVDEIRKIRRDAYILPNECEKKVYIIKNGQNLNIQAQNALLKILEEPPSYACFIIECINEKKLMDTILSRCSIYRFYQDVYDIDSEDFEKAKQMVMSFVKKDELALLEIKIKTKVELLSVITFVKIFLRDCLILEEQKCIDFYTCSKLAEARNVAEIYQIYDICVKIESLCEFNVSVSNMLYYFVTELYKK